VEDHISTGGSSIINANAIRELDGIVKYVVATTTYETQKSKEELGKAGLALYTLTTGKNIVDHALVQKVLTPEQKEMVDEWFANPLGWGKKHGFE
jgi:orotate phosphoribosyltransferase